jgi:hypothetical protein
MGDTNREPETTMSLTSYYPEMNEVKPVADIEARLSHYGKHWYLSTPLTLTGRGVSFEDKHTDARRSGWNRYKVTEKAFQTICGQYRVTTESHL